MGVQRSLAFTNIRKSVGEVTYYRVRGVQLARTKPTFPPDRIFSVSQREQQAKMKIAQATMVELGANTIAPYCNCSNNKRYNSSSQTNRLVSNLIKHVDQEAVTMVVDGDDTVVNVAKEYLKFTMQGFSIGNLALPELIKSTYTQVGASILVKLFFGTSDFEYFLRSAQSILKWKQPVSGKDCIVVGRVATKGFYGVQKILKPYVCTTGIDQGYSYLGFEFGAGTSETISQDIDMTLAVAVSRQYSIFGDSTTRLARVCTSSFDVSSVKQV